LQTTPVQVIQRTTTYRSETLAVSDMSEPGGHLSVTRFGSAPRGSGVVQYLNVETTDLIKRAFLRKVVDPTMMQDKNSFLCVEGKYFPLKFAEKGEVEGSQKGAWDFFLGVKEEVAPKELNVYREVPSFTVKRMAADLKDCTSPEYATAVPTSTKELHFKFALVCSEHKCKVRHAQGEKCSCEKCPMRGHVGGMFSFYFDKEGRFHILTPYSTIALFLTTNECQHKRDLVRVQNYNRLESQKKGFIQLLTHSSAKSIR
jgi:hypothetical protein